MFLSKTGSSGRFKFDEIYSCLQKSLRRGDVKLSLEMAKEFKDYPNALKIRLVQNCCEDCPNIYLINDIFNTKSELNELIKFIPYICTHIKCREALLGFRVAVELPHIFEPLNSNDTDLLTLLRKVFTLLCQNDTETIINFFQGLVPKEIKLKRIYNFISKNRTFIYMLCAWKCLPYVTNKNYDKPTIEYVYPNFDLNTCIITKLPNYIYDKHVSKSPKQQKTYEFFIKNCILYPRNEKTELELEAERLYLESNVGTSAFIKPIIKNTMIIPDDVKLIQTQLITAKGKPKTYYCDLDNNGKYQYILKGPYRSPDDVNRVIMSDYIKRKVNLIDVDCKAVSYKNDLYLLCLNVVDINESNIINKSSKLESSVIIYNGEHYLFNHEYLNLMNSEQELELLKILAFRKIIGTNDNCPRNIIYFDGMVVSIDDPILYKSTNFVYKTSLNENIKNRYLTLLNTHFNELLAFLNSFKKVVNELDNSVIGTNEKKFMLNRINELSTASGWKF